MSEERLEFLVDRYAPVSRPWRRSLGLAFTGIAATVAVALFLVPTAPVSTPDVAAARSQSDAYPATTLNRRSVDSRGSSPSAAAPDSIPASARNAVHAPSYRSAHPAVGTSLENSSGPATTPTATRSTDQSPIVIDVEPERVIELSAEELKRIGIRIDSTGVVEAYWSFLVGNTDSNSVTPTSILDAMSVRSENSQSSTMRAGRTRVVDQTSEQKVEVSVQPDWGLRLPPRAPAHVTNASGQRFPVRWQFQSSSSEVDRTYNDSISSMIDGIESRTATDPLKVSQMIPILVSVSDRFPERPDLIFWFWSDAEIFAALPPHIEVQLRKEMEELHEATSCGQVAYPTWYRSWIDRTMRQYDSVLEAHHVPTDLIAAGTGSCYMSFCHVGSGALTTAPLQPNPAHAFTIVHYHLDEARATTITLHDMRGQQLDVLARSEQSESGDVSKQVSFGSIPAGVYLLAITTDRGEQAVQRLVVN